MEFGSWNAAGGMGKWERKSIGHDLKGNFGRTTDDGRVTMDDGEKKNITEKIRRLEGKKG